MWSDRETDVDLLGFQVHSDLIRDVVTDINLLPVTVGIFGDWGSGKSSVMRMLMRDLDGQDEVAYIYFNGWQFEGYDDAKSALIHSILLELGEHQQLKEKIKDKIAPLLKRINLMRLANIGYQTIVAPIAASYLASMMGTPGVGPVLPVPNTTLSQPAMPIPDEDDLAKIDLTELVNKNPATSGFVGVRQFREDFEELIAETNLTSLVILIDDLDRCEPTRLVETLEAIKLFLAVPHVAFVIGADERIVRYAIAKRYETGQVEAEERQTDRHVDLVTDYLEKLIQIPYHLPRLSPSEIETYLSLLFCQHHLKDEFEMVRQAVQKLRQEDISATFGDQQIIEALPGKEISDMLKLELAWCNSIAPAISDVLKGNPRQTIERTFAYLKQHYGLKNLSVRGFVAVSRYLISRCLGAIALSLVAHQLGRPDLKTKPSELLYSY